MSAVTKNDITKALAELGIKNGDMVLVHSSFKSLGPVEDGAETVILGFLDAVGEDGTLVFPTFTQNDFENAYETWHLDKHSDTGYLTNYFRKREGSIRSDQATHSVAAAGKRAAWLTETHGHTSKRIGNMGDTAFAPDSPWEKMYQENAKVVLIGVNSGCITFRHYAESVYVEDCLKRIEGSEKYDYMEDRIGRFKKPGLWPSVCNEWAVAQLEEKGLVKKVKCGEAELSMVEAQTFVDFVLSCLKNRDNRILWDINNVWTADWAAWVDELESLQSK
ncbi:MAG: AAC(3) family N-acetyltransferase [Clostridia bacterium]|nr:AAC(3) family N-acetyltransferase [Clostridia bacterium]